jgi:hypothetical protein
MKRAPVDAGFEAMSVDPPAKEPSAVAVIVRLDPFPAAYPTATDPSALAEGLTPLESAPVMVVVARVEVPVAVIAANVAVPVNVGLAENTRLPEPVSSPTIAASSADVSILLVVRYPADA